MFFKKSPYGGKQVAIFRGKFYVSSWTVRRHFVLHRRLGILLLKILTAFDAAIRVFMGTHACLPACVLSHLFYISIAAFRQWCCQVSGGVMSGYLDFISSLHGAFWGFFRLSTARAFFPSSTISLLTMPGQKVDSYFVVIQREGALVD